MNLENDLFVKTGSGHTHSVEKWLRNKRGFSQDEKGASGSWVAPAHPCAACQSCEADTPWTRGIVLQNNTIVP